MHMIQHNRLSHALLFLGKEGSGALSLARAFAQFTVCERVNGKPAAATPQSAEPSLFGEPMAETEEQTQQQKPADFTDSCGE